MNWYRLEIGADGQVLSCVVVESAGESSKAVFYVRAASDPTAVRAAMSRYAQAYRGAFKAAGLCVCGGKRVEGYVSCAECRVRHKLSNENRSQRHTGGKVEPSPSGPRQPLSSKPTRVLTGADAIRLSVLNEVRQAWIAQSTILQFAEWLAEQICALDPSAAPKSEAAA